MLVTNTTQAAARPRVKLAAIACDEATNIPSWVFHHLYFGFDSIEIWVNQTFDNSVAILSDLNIYTKGKVSFRVVDDILEHCMSIGMHFQAHAYTCIMEQTKEEGLYDYLLFLDLDEYWTPRDFSQHISDSLVLLPIADAVSYNWYFDVPDYSRLPWGIPYKSNNLLIKDRHVKTIIKLSGRVTSCAPHNHSISEGVYQLQDGTSFSEDPLSPMEHYLNSLEIDNYFIFHQIHRSQIEYMISLCRSDRAYTVGKFYNGYEVGPFKVARDGYCPGYMKKTHHILDFKPAAVLLDRYNLERTNFMSHSLRIAHTAESQYYALQKSRQGMEQIHGNPDYLDTYHTQLKGLKFNDMFGCKIDQNSLFYSIDQIEIDSYSNLIVISGWRYHRYEEKLPKLIAESADGEFLTLITIDWERSDVMKVYCDAPLKCGFHTYIPICYLLEALTPAGLPILFYWSGTDRHLGVMKNSTSINEVIHRLLHEVS